MTRFSMSQAVTQRQRQTCGKSVVVLPGALRLRWIDCGPLLLQSPPFLLSLVSALLFYCRISLLLFLLRSLVTRLLCLLPRRVSVLASLTLHPLFLLACPLRLVLLMTHAFPSSKSWSDAMLALPLTLTLVLLILISSSHLISSLLSSLSLYLLLLHLLSLISISLPFTVYDHKPTARHRRVSPSAARRLAPCPLCSRRLRTSLNSTFITTPARRAFVKPPGGDQ